MEIEISDINWLDENLINVCFQPKHLYFRKKATHFKEFEVTFDNYENIVENYLPFASEEIQKVLDSI